MGGSLAKEVATPRVNAGDRLHPKCGWQRVLEPPVRRRELNHRSGLVNAAVVDTEPIGSELSVILDEALAKAHVAPGVTLLALHRGGDDRLYANHRSHQPCLTAFQKLRRHPAQRAVLIDRVSQSERRGKRNQSIKVQLERIKTPDNVALLRRFIPVQHEPKLRFDRAMMPQI